MSNAPKFDLRGANIGNLAETVQGDQIAHLQSLSKPTRDVSPQVKPDSLILFYSYAHKDEILRDELDKHLSLLKREGSIDAWYDRDINAGSDWTNAIDTNLNTADIILLLVSANFLASDYCYETELTCALDRHGQGEACVIPIILKPCDWESAPFGELAALPTAHSEGIKPVTLWTNQDEAFLAIAKGIRKAAEAVRKQKQD
ncbi:MULTISPECIES: toll/interleukin-1 receptor domain-containing protein [Leptolyngbya]|uniref:toll/interleukin-1 receptor domain-containing protein n=1 Tax=Leptolyngbya TaxID=47251 RepID=UPI001685A929|nr:toll/interleukin-1 receptor domain-containing protein [Leptolyngbya sp. FACHB-1624]MBD1854794.1 toll/interleukin-1 receptor domain-containing protein [Leptolyngbya sp. FACHB-1624]